MEIALRFHVMVRRISSNISRFTRPIFATYSPYEHALCADVGSTIFSNLSWDVAMATKKYCCNEGKLILHAFFARSPDGSWFSFCYYLLLMPLYRVKKFLVKIGPVVSAQSILIEIALRVHVVVRHMSSNIRSSFSDSSRDVAIATNFVANYLPPCTYRSAIQKRNGITLCMCMIK